ncbi:MAG: Na+/H+ antiporter subunit E [Candidatus Omnitrophica bacterium]|nr:Na+/H+ antiporter subunit E [Candidatus Omnitrophota bacterium]
MKVKIIIFILAFLLWLLLSWSVDPVHLFLGVLIAVLVCFVTADIFLESPQVFKKPSRYLWFVYYIILFAWECFKANLDGAWRVIHPDLPINPGIVKVKTQLKSEVGLTFLANSLTLKPGTMTVDIDKENGFLYIHWSDVKAQDVEKATELIVRKFERVLMRIFP